MYTYDFRYFNISTLKPLNQRKLRNGMELADDALQSTWIWRSYREFSLRDYDW